MRYIEPLYRPPSEAQSLILQVTNGCSWNRCTFCEMYTQPQKKFRLTPQANIDAFLAGIAATGTPVRRVFLADGDAMTLSVRRLQLILTSIRRHLPDVRRIASYCLPRNLRHKTVAELAALREMGLSLFYVGCESGDDLVLRFRLTEKSSKPMRAAAGGIAGLKLQGESAIRNAVMKLNVMIGAQYSAQHAGNSARIMNAAQPDFQSTLVVSFPLSSDHRP